MTVDLVAEVLVDLTNAILKIKDLEFQLSQKDMIISKLLDNETRNKETKLKQDFILRDLLQVRASAEYILKDNNKLIYQNKVLGNALGYCKTNNARLRRENSLLKDQIENAYVLGSI